MTRHLALVTSLVLATAGCPGPPPAEADAVAVSISPDYVRVILGNTVQFTATVTGTTNRAVDWTLTGAECSGTACGTIDANGVYTAPDTVPIAESVRVSARARADENASDEATVVIGSLVSVLVSPAGRLIFGGGSQRFTATVTGSANTAVSWSIEGDDCDPVRCGTIDDAGLYRAPNRVINPAWLLVSATAHADRSRSGSADVTVMSSPIAHDLRQ